MTQSSLHKADIQPVEESTVTSESASQMASKFLANMGHEIRTPLTAISGFCQLLYDQAKSYQLPQEAQHHLQMIIKNEKILSEVITNMLDLSKLETDRLEVIKETIHFKQLFQNLYHFHKQSAQEKQLHYTYDYDPELPLYIQLDRSKLNQILKLLLGNAIKLTPIGKSVQISTYKKKGSLVIQVSSTGQTNHSTTHSLQGAEVELAFINKMVQLLGGTLIIGSELQQATVFTLTLPLIAASTPNSFLKEEREEPCFSKENIVVLIEDRPANRYLIQVILQEWGLTIHMAENGEVGKQTIQHLVSSGKIPDLVLMDLYMPKMNGFETTHHLKQDSQTASIPIVAMSADTLDCLEELQRKGFSDSLSKPIDQEKLFTVLRKYLRQDIPKTVVQSPKKPPIPLEQKTHVLSELKLLSQMPIYYTDKILEKVEKLQFLCESYESTYSLLLESLKNSILQGDTKQYDQLLYRIHSDH